MSSVVSIVRLISNLVVEKLQTAGYPPLQAGQILLGRQFQAENTVPPRIIFVPMSSTFGPKNLSNPLPASSNQPYSPEAKAQIQQRAILTESITWEVRCWSATANMTPDPDPDGDLEATSVLVQAVLIAVHLLVPNGYKVPFSGQWVDAKEGSTQHVHLGREFVFPLTIHTPVPDTLLPLAPSNVSAALSSLMVGPDGVTGAGCT